MELSDLPLDVRLVLFVRDAVDPGTGVLSKTPECLLPLRNCDQVSDGVELPFRILLGEFRYSVVVCEPMVPSSESRYVSFQQIRTLASPFPPVGAVAARFPSPAVPHLRRCRVGGGAPSRWPPSAAQTARTVFPYAAVTKTQTCRDAREGINPSKFTSPYSRYSVVTGSCFHPPLRQRLNRCDQIRRTIQRSSGWKSIRTWARL